LTDARAIWDYVNRDGISGEGVILMGQSLGTGVVAGLAGNLADEGMIAYDLADGRYSPESYYSYCSFYEYHGLAE